MSGIFLCASTISAKPYPALSDLSQKVSSDDESIIANMATTGPDDNDYTDSDSGDDGCFDDASHHKRKTLELLLAFQTAKAFTLQLGQALDREGVIYRQETSTIVDHLNSTLNFHILNLLLLDEQMSCLIKQYVKIKSPGSS
jgi:hypothetical protein